MIRIAAVAVLFLSWARAEEPKPANPPAPLGIPFVIHWNTNDPGNHSVVLTGNLSSALGQSSPEKAFVVQVEQEEIRSAIGLPPMSGKYAIAKDRLEFRPRFPFQPGIRYRAMFQPKTGKPVTSVLQIPRPKQTPTTVVSQIYPTADVLPENLLKFYLYFSAPMSGGQIYEHFRVTDDRGKVVDLPFLEIDEELWNPEMTRLTLFIDPGRIKRGVKPLEDIGPALEAGKSYTLRIAASWLDATGTPLKESFEKKFRVTAPDREAPDLAKWEIATPKAGTMAPLKITFSDPMDHALALRMISIDKTKGTAHLEQNERVWIFTPEQPWKPGSYRLLVQTTIEDLVGNNVGKPFEVDLFSEVQKRLTREVAERTFELR